MQLCWTMAEMRSLCRDRCNQADNARIHGEWLNAHANLAAALFLAEQLEKAWIIHPPNGFAQTLERSQDAANFEHIQRTFDNNTLHFPPKGKE